MVKLPIYMDNQATTRLDPRVVEAMLPYFGEVYGNPASDHRFGWEAAEAVRTARETLARALNASGPEEIFFTSGATESDNLAIKGVALALEACGNHLITCQTEHKAVLESCRSLERDGFRVTYLPVKSDGVLDLDQLAEAITPQTMLVSIMHANNEIGVVQDIAAIGAICRERGVLLHSDMAQSLGKIAVDVRAMGVDLASFSAHKLYGPKGIGALYVRDSSGVRFVRPQMDGGGQEQGLRSGTLNVPAIVGFGKAVEVCLEEEEEEEFRLSGLRDHLSEVLRASLRKVYVNGHRSQRLPGNLNVSFVGVDSESLLMRLGDVALSTGSACTATEVRASHVLTALGLPEERTRTAVRFSLGRFNTEDEVDYVIQRCYDAVTELRRISPLG